MDNILIDDVVDTTVANMPLAWVRQVVRLARHANLAEIMEQPCNDTAFVRQVRRETGTKFQQGGSDID